MIYDDEEEKLRSEIRMKLREWMLKNAPPPKTVEVIREAAKIIEVPTLAEEKLEEIAKAIKAKNADKPDFSKLEKIIDKFIEQAKKDEEERRKRVVSVRSPSQVGINDADGTRINPRKEDGHGSSAGNPTFVSGTITTALDFIDLTRGSTSSLAQTSTATLVTYIAVAGDTLWGFNGTGTRSGLFQLKINGVVKLAGRISTGDDDTTIHLPAPKQLSVSDTVLLEVTNEGQGTGDYEGTVIIGNV